MVARSALGLRARPLAGAPPGRDRREPEQLSEVHPVSARLGHVDRISPGGRMDRFIGIDVAKAALDIAVLPASAHSVVAWMRYVRVG